MSEPPEQREWAAKSPPLQTACRVAVAAIVILTPIAYWHSLRGGFLIDDDILLTDSALIKAADGVWRFWWSAEAIDYWPVSNTSLWLEWRLWGERPLGYRITNLLLHVIESLLFWRILARLAIPGAAVAALLFALHPVNVETVAWISQRKTLLALLFAQLSALAFLKSEERRAFRPMALWYAASLLCFAAALLSKVSVAIFPLLLVLMIAWLRPLVRGDAARLAPFFFTAAALVGVNLWFRARDPNIDVRMDFVEAALRAGCSVWFYLWKALLPIDLAFMYEPWHLDAAQLRWWVPSLAAVAATGLLWRYRDTWSRPLLFAWLYYWVALSPSIGLTEMRFPIEDHYQHPALIAVTAVGAAGWQRWRERSWRSADGILLAVVAAFALLTWRHAALFVDNVTLMRAAAATYPQSATAHRNLAFARLHAGDARGAQHAAREAVELDPAAVEARKVLAAALAATGDRAAAIGQLRVALQLGAADAETLGNLGAFLRESGDPREALPYLDQAVQRSPRSVRLRCNLGKTLLELGEAGRAMRHFEEALRLQPDSTEARILLEAAREAGPVKKQSHR